MKRYTVGALAGTTDNGEQNWLEKDCRTRRGAIKLAREVSQECGTAMVADAKSNANPLVVFKWGREVR